MCAGSQLFSFTMANIRMYNYTECNIVYISQEFTDLFKNAKPYRQDKFFRSGGGGEMENPNSKEAY